MPLTGGAADKFGNRYEGLWTIRCMTDVMMERADTIRLEPPGDEGKGFEFRIQIGNVREYHQVKRQVSVGQWTLAQLSRNGVLSNFLEKLRQDDASCVFVSMPSAEELRELGERARHALSVDEFRTAFLTSESLKQNFSVLQNHWADCTEGEAYEYLRRTYVRGMDEQSLRDTLRDRLENLVDGDPAVAEASLAKLALDNIHQELTTFDLWRQLALKGINRRQWDKDTRILAAIDKANEQYLGSFPKPTIGDQVMKRSEVGEVLAAINGKGKRRGVLLTGEAGVGKSGVILQLLAALRNRGIPFLAFRIDRLDAAQRPEHVGNQLGLPGSPAAVLSATAAGRDCVIIIDQLDAVSLASGQRPTLFDCIAELARRAASQPNVFVVLACRTFDLENDFRFRQLIGEHGFAAPLRVKRLSQGEVRDTVSALGLYAASLTPSQVELLEVPLHLSLLAEIAPDPKRDPLDFETVTDLYDMFWNRKQDLISMRRDSPAQHWLEVMDRLSNHMSSHQTLTAPRWVVEDFESDVRAIASEHVLVQVGDGRKFAFFHDGFFDYVFARRFLVRGDDLLALLRGDEQGPFRRAQVRQILAYERDEDRDRYLGDLRAILAGSEIRSHIKAVTFALLAQRRDPTREEWEVIAPMTFGAEFLASRSWGVLRGSPAWFRLLDGLKLIEEWLASEDEERVDRTVWLLASVYEELTDRVTELVTPYVCTSTQWDLRLSFLVTRPLLGDSRPYLDLFLRLIDKGVLDDMATRRPDFWAIIHSLPKQNSKWACEVVGHYFNRRWALTVKSGMHNPFGASGTIPESQLAKSVLLESARRTPKSFSEAVLPFMLKVIEANARKGKQLPIMDDVWEYRLPGDTFDLSSVLLAAADDALRRLAADDPQAFERIAAPLLESDFDTVQFLLVRAYAAHGESLANAAADFLCQRQSRFRSGYMSDPHWATHELLASITPFCSSDRLTRLEELILNYYPWGELEADEDHRRGFAQHILLDGIAEQRRGTMVSNRLQELRNKFGVNRPSAPMGITVGFVASPVPQSVVEHMSDDEWLAAITTHADDDTTLVKGDQILGGASQVAQQLAKQVENDPDRFAQLALRIPDDANTAYFDAVLRGLDACTNEAKKNYPTDMGWQKHLFDKVSLEHLMIVCERCHRLPERPCGRSLASLVSNLAAAPLPDQALEMVGWYATNDSNPETELWRTSAPGSDAFYYGGNIENAGLNSVRGSAAEAIGQLMFQEPSRAEIFWPVLDRLVEDESIAVRSWVAQAITAVLPHDRTAAVQWFMRLCDTEDALLGTRSVERFLKYALMTHYVALAPILERMLLAEDEKVVRAGARQVCLAALEFEEAKPLADRCLTGSEPMRLAAAEIYAANLGQAGLRQVCEDALRTLFHDESANVRLAASSWPSGVQGAELGNYQDFMHIFIESPAFVEGYRSFLDALDQTTASVPDTICHSSKKFLEFAGSKVADVTTQEAGDADDVSKLLIRAYGQASSRTTRDRCLDLIDRMTELSAWGLESAISSYDR